MNGIDDPGCFKIRTGINLNVSEEVANNYHIIAFHIDFGCVWKPELNDLAFMKICCCQGQ
jgi:hypothetical protein